MNQTRPAPYPTDTRAKGWRFELDMERAHQSDTWTLAPADVRPWLLMLWATAWEQTPCGSLPDDDALIAARIGMTPKLWAKHKAILLRKWWKADDGRMYHDVLVQRVIEMMERRRKESDRKALARARKAADDQGCPADVPRDNHGNAEGFHPQGDTGTGTGTGSKDKDKNQGAKDGGEPLQLARPDSVQEPKGEQPTPAGAACRAIKAAGVTDVNPGHPGLQRLLAGGVTADELADTARELAGKGKGRFALLLSTVEARRTDVAKAGDLPSAPVALWHESRAGIEDKGAEVGIGRWDEKAFSLGRGEAWPAYRCRVFRAAGHEPLRATA